MEKEGGREKLCVSPKSPANDKGGPGIGYEYDLIDSRPSWLNPNQPLVERPSVVKGWHVKETSGDGPENTAGYCTPPLELVIRGTDLPIFAHMAQAQQIDHGFL